MSGVLYIRCMAHRNVRQMNTTEATGAECAVCAFEGLRDILAAWYEHWRSTVGISQDTIERLAAGAPNAIYDLAVRTDRIIKASGAGLATLGYPELMPQAKQIDEPSTWPARLSE